ncbi:hypothetical protein LTR10_011755 [Elasticomyces elasticus]|uniref:Major facilitator superfamily (MFS) profile domain-containing protein n=1 Tax=Exophiala sideris TaxID=1016849 RepID=A0ABR0JDE1_9EURO|nr:hypothetical protein LTR10_011755 [Elasticomyces elasticus]KAK5031788.1 hypothetical protein LTS07_004408 [Exophiala sideris]KAK5040717.1 hypothetical protein LTR13_003017 [Exophiala sideris]KAK5061949.1 hypothetical protein LTR69_005133 [Exophiala sideris]KAK5184649.1 hypothetical protein LTR44_003324 [Eurotiomycetes sp. CCFEE 6388]
MYNPDFDYSAFAGKGFLPRLRALTGVTGYRMKNKGTGTVVRDMLLMASRPHFFALNVFYMLTFMWSIGLNTTLILFLEPPPPAGYGFSNLTVALFYIAPMLASLIGELFGHWFNDFIANRHIRRSGGTYDAEVRLWTLYVSVVFLVAGLVLFGYGLKLHLPWIALVMAWAFYMFGVVTETVAITAYALDVFPDYGVEAAAIIGIFRTSGGFIVNYFQVEWATSAGPVTAFGIEAGIVAASFLLVLAAHFMGQSWRGKYPFPPAKTH